MKSAGTHLPGCNELLWKFQAVLILRYKAGKYIYKMVNRSPHMGLHQMYE